MQSSTSTVTSQTVALVLDALVYTVVTLISLCHLSLSLHLASFEEPRLVLVYFTKWWILTCHLKKCCLFCSLNRGCPQRNGIALYKVVLLQPHFAMWKFQHQIALILQLYSSGWLSSANGYRPNSQNCRLEMRWLTCLGAEGVKQRWRCHFGNTGFSCL